MTYSIVVCFNDLIYFDPNVHQLGRGWKDDWWLNLIEPPSGVRQHALTTFPNGPLLSTRKRTQLFTTFVKIIEVCVTEGGRLQGSCRSQGLTLLWIM